VVDSSAAVDNLRAYFNETGLAADGNVQEAVLIILNKAFADMDPIDIEALWTA
jgi:hypothetical protein